MKALKWYGREDLRYEDVPEVFPGKGQVKVKVHLTGICGSDLHEYQSGPLFISTEPHPLTGRMAPITLGHEFVGTVAETGEGVTTLNVGDRVTGDCTWYCGRCYYCVRNMPNLCIKAASTGFHADGSLAEYVVVPDYSLYKLIDTITDDIGALTEPLAVGVHAVRRSRLQIGDTVAIIGAGTIGISTLLAAKAAGASSVFVLELSRKRGERALAMGATTVINANGGAVSRVRDLTEGLGADISFDCVGLAKTGPLALGLIRNAGTAVIVGMSWQPSDFRFVDIMLTEKNIVGSIGYVRDTNAVIELLADHRIDPGALITGKVEFEDAVRLGFEELVRNPEDHLKILVKCT